MDRSLTLTHAQEAIASLIELAQQGEIDPWDVQVIDVIDRFLRELGTTSTRPADLSRSGQAFVWASMLVLLKAQTLERLEMEEPEEAGEPEVTVAEDNERLPRSFEHHLRRRSSAPPRHKRRVTLQELIAQIQQIAAEFEKVPSRPTPHPRLASRREATRAIQELAHNENLIEVAAQLEQFFQLNLSELQEEGYIELDELLEFWKCHFSPEATRADRVGVFWALLLLSAQSKVELHQTEFYQDLKIKPLGKVGWEIGSRE